MELWRGLFRKYSVSQKNEAYNVILTFTSSVNRSRTLVFYRVWTDLSCLSGKRTSIRAYPLDPRGRPQCTCRWLGVYGNRRPQCTCTSLLDVQDRFPLDPLGCLSYSICWVVRLGRTVPLVADVSPVYLVGWLGVRPLMIKRVPRCRISCPNISVFLFFV